MSGRHETHTAIVQRLKRADGHLRKIIEMIEQDRPCVDVAQQLAAVDAAVRNAKQAFIRDHIDNCLGSAAPGGADAKAALAELRDISKYL
jgi:DNA-binding FrmR family transcriptional regulator